VLLLLGLVEKVANAHPMTGLRGNILVGPFCLRRFKSHDAALKHDAEAGGERRPPWLFCPVCVGHGHGPAGPPPS
jgi:hypothetical protein